VPVAQFLVDVSAWVRYPQPVAAGRLDDLATSGVLATCGLVELHLLGALAEREEFSVPWMALLVAAVAERHAVTVLHANPCFDLVTAVTGQRVEAVA
jgi:hypothetical protein